MSFISKFLPKKNTFKMEVSYGSVGVTEIVCKQDDGTRHRVHFYPDVPQGETPVPYSVLVAMHEHLSEPVKNPRTKAERLVAQSRLVSLMAEKDPARFVVEENAAGLERDYPQWQ